MQDRIVVSLFSGAGGLSAGFTAAGSCPVLAAELDQDAVATYRANISDAAIKADIGTETERIVAEVRRRAGSGPIFAVVGGPPCQGFSTAGARDHADPRNRLVFSYLDIVGELRPEWFLFENVEGILTSGGGDALIALAEQFTGLGYSFRVDKVNFARWGVPQARKRVLIVGNRRGLPIRLPEPTYGYDGKKHRSAHARTATTLGDALAGLPAEPAASHRDTVPYTTSTPINAFDACMRTRAPGPTAHAVIAFDRDVARIKQLRTGQSLRDLPEDLWPKSFRSRAFRRVADGMPTEKRGGAPAGLRRLDPDHAALTITSFAPREFIHPDHDRPISLRECARLQTFPDQYDFEGGFASIAKQIGNAVPPMAAKILARWISDIDGRAGGDANSGGASTLPGLVGYHLTDSTGMSPALRKTDERLHAITRSDRRLIVSKSKPPPDAPQLDLLVDVGHTRLGPEARKIVADARSLGPITMSDRELARLVAIVLRDLGHEDRIPEWARDVPPDDYFEVPLSWFTQDEHRPFDFGRFFLGCCEAVQGFAIIFRCITKLHRHRRKFEVILRTQPLPTMDQVARRGLLEFGKLPIEGLASWLT